MSAYGYKQTSRRSCRNVCLTPESGHYGQGWGMAGIDPIQTFDDATAHRQLASCYGMMGRIDEALEALKG